MPDAFNRLPVARLEVKAVPSFLEKTAASGYYRGAFLQICMTSKRQQNLACGLWPGAFL
jgi:uncharacterized protein (DUF885 family)